MRVVQSRLVAPGEEEDLDEVLQTPATPVPDSIPQAEPDGDVDYF